MESENFRKVKELLPKLTMEEKKVITKLLSAQVTGFTGKGTTTKGKFVENENDARLVESALKEITTVYYPKLVSGRDGKILGEALVTLNEFWESLNFEDIRKTQAIKLAFFIEVFRATVSFLRENQIPVSARTILNQHLKYRGFLDNCYPGYMGVGALFVRLVLLRNFTVKS